MRPRDGHVQEGRGRFLRSAAENIEADFKIRPPGDPAKAEREHRERMRTLAMTWSLAGGALVAACLLCWMFLHYNRPEDARTVVTAFIGFLGGIGLGKALPSER